MGYVFEINKTYFRLWHFIRYFPNRQLTLIKVRIK